MASEESRSQEEMSRLLLRELRSQQNARFLQRMPAFRIDEGLPGKMRTLLDELDRVERRGGGGGGNQAGALGAFHNPER